MDMDYKSASTKVNWFSPGELFTTNMYTPEEIDLGNANIRLLVDNMEKPTIVPGQILLILGRKESGCQVFE